MANPRHSFAVKHATLATPLVRSAVLRACLQQLSSAHRQVIDLVYYHEQSIEEIARIIGVPQNTVKTRVFHARKRIAELMAARAAANALGCNREAAPRNLTHRKQNQFDGCTSVCVS